jgi:hypothetical protein
VTHTCNPSYSGGRDQQDCGSKPAGVNGLRSHPEKTHHIIGLGECLRCSPEFKPQHHKRKKSHKDLLLVIVSVATTGEYRER